MEPFSIQCTTCNSRIKVRNSELIGQVVNCPKCNSMLMVAAPGQIRVENSGPPVDSMAMTQDGMTPDFNPEDAQPSTEQPRDDEYRLAPVEEEPAFEPVQQSAPQSSGYEQSDSPLLPSDDWTSESATKTKQYLLVGFVGFSGVVVAIIVFVAFLNWYGKEKDSDTESLAQNDSVNQIGAEDVEDGVAAADEGGQAPLTDEGDTPAEDTVVDDGTPADASVGESQGTEGTDEQATGEVAASQGDSGAGVEANAGAGENPAGGDEENTSALPDELIGDASSDAAASAAQTPQEKLPNERLAVFGPVLDWQVQPTLNDTGLTLGAPPITAEDLGIEADESQNAIADIDWPTQAAIVLPGLILGEQPLSQSINLWSQMSGVPTRLSFDSMAAANLDRRQNAALGKFQAASVAEIAPAIADKLGLSADIKETRYMEFAASEQAIASKLPKQVAIQDLLPEAEQYAWLAQALREMFPGTDDAWNVADGQLSYDANRIDLLTWFRAIRLLETWRTAAGLPSAMEGYDPRNLQNVMVDPRSLTALDKELSQFSPLARPISQVLSDAGSECQIQVWVDWPSVVRNGLGPKTTEVMSTYGRTLRELLLDVAEEYSLVVAFQSVDEVWLTNRRSYRTQPQIYVRKSDGLTAEQWKEKLIDWTPLTDQGVGRIDAVLTPDNQYVILRCCRPSLPDRFLP